MNLNYFLQILNFTNLKADSADSVHAPSFMGHAVEIYKNYRSYVQELEYLSASLFLTSSYSFGLSALKFKPRNSHTPLNSLMESRVDSIKSVVHLNLLLAAIFLLI